MNKPIEKQGDGDDFTIFLFSHGVNEPNSIKLELGPPENGVQIGLHIFQELLQIFVDGLKYLFGQHSDKQHCDKNCDNIGKVDINSLGVDDIDLMKRYFLSIGFKLILDVFDRKDYISRPDIFNDKSLIKENTMLDEYFYEVVTYVDDQEKIYRVSFKFNGL
tara:strand:+ start:123 stop:608 length:486 start_codon:yes stop_codon:yes gene_type:complete